MDWIIVDDHVSNALELLQPMYHTSKKVTHENLVAVASGELPLFLNGLVSLGTDESNQIIGS